MLIFLQNSKRFITAVEGTGDSLTKEDVEDGFKDYLMTSVYKLDGEEIVLEDGGQLLTSKLVATMPTADIIDRLLDYWEAKDEPYVLLEGAL